MKRNEALEREAQSVNPLPAGTSAVFSADSLSLLRQTAKPVRVSAGDCLYRENEPANRLYLVTAGSFKVSKPLGDGTSVTLYLHIPGDLFGEPDPLELSAHRFEARALEDSEAGEILQAEVNGLLQANGAFALEFMNWMGTIHRMTQSKFRDLLLYGKSGALCSLLLRLSNMYGPERGGRPVIGKRITNSEMAEMIGATRESVNRMLSDMRSQGVISVEGGRIVINDPDYLRNVCHCESCTKDICRM
ncbi:MAG TPA: Crp/Fnr family transcriptional regulator [Paenibacillus sp.]|uniref:Crp/Fnr family transcriptional regulator n=1 Tax=Paenibacillus sp. TaxID=58172 RepID=UPI002C8225FD|nr:Crp/Fnr family transcriptional regulator [Paenibacillus sp.]HUC94215.1 Crp/Fnr family transcriptional regulator [Paenibacillus sp.]